MRPRVERSKAADVVERSQQVAELVRVLLEVVQLALAGAPDRVRPSVFAVGCLVVDAQVAVRIVGEDALSVEALLNCASKPRQIVVRRSEFT
jgi:hypothetical protein